MSGSTPRRGAIDLARVGALVLVVLGHLSMAVIDRGPDGALRGANAIALHPGLAWLAMLAPMPVFFAAAGWANATATPRTAAGRLRPLVGLAAVVVCVWSAAAGVEVLVTTHRGLVGDGARIATQPLWFLAAYVPFATAGAGMARLARRPLCSVGACVVLLLGLDVARFRFHAPHLIGWLGFAAAWAIPWLIGAAWRQRSIDGSDLRWERRAGTLAAAIAALAAAALVAWWGYFPSLIDAVPGKRSNTSPPTLFTAVAAMVQVGLLMVVAAPLDRGARRLRRLLDRAGEAAVAVYAWHLTALALCAALLATGVWTPTRFGVGWWLTRPLWLALVLGVTAVFVAATASLRGRHARATVDPSRSRTLVGVAAATVAAAVVGRWGPRSLLAALLPAIGFVFGWWCLRGSPIDRHRTRFGGEVPPPR